MLRRRASLGRGSQTTRQQRQQCREWSLRACGKFSLVCKWQRQVRQLSYCTTILLYHVSGPTTNPRNFRGGVKERGSFVSGTPKLGLRWLFLVGNFWGRFGGASYDRRARGICTALVMTPVYVRTRSFWVRVCVPWEKFARKRCCFSQNVPPALSAEKVVKHCFVVTQCCSGLDPGFASILEL